MRVRLVLPGCKMGVRLVLPGCKMGVRLVLPGCEMGVRLVLPGCVMGVRRVLPGCEMGVHLVLPGCEMVVRLLLPECEMGVRLVLPGCEMGPDMGWGRSVIAIQPLLGFAESTCCLRPPYFPISTLDAPPPSLLHPNLCNYPHLAYLTLPGWGDWLCRLPWT